MPAFEPIQFWHWWALGGMLAIVEVLVPGFTFLWIGIAAGMTGCLLLVWPGLGMPGQILAFAALSVACAIAWRRLQTARPALSDEPYLNRRGAQFVGQHGRLVAAIVNGRGRIELADGSWPVAGPELPLGTNVEVTGADGTLLQVRPAAESPVRPPPPAPGAAVRPGAKTA